mgnify:FL=1
MPRQGMADRSAARHPREPISVFQTLRLVRELATLVGTWYGSRTRDNQVHVLELYPLS